MIQKYLKFSLPAITGILLLFLGANVLADTGSPATIKATYNSATHILTTSGTYNFSACPDNHKAVGFAIFINGANPINPGTGALDGSGVVNSMHPANVANYVFPCVSPGSWGTDTHTVATVPNQVCVVIYDVHDDNLPPHTGGHSTVGAGNNHNTDNSYEHKSNAYPAGSCINPVLVSPSPTPSQSPTPTPTPTPEAVGGSNVNITNNNNNSNDNHNEQNQDQTNNQNVTVNVTSSTGIVKGVKTPTITPETGISVLGMTSMFGAGPIGFVLSRFGKGRISKKREETLSEVAMGLFSHRNDNSKQA